MIKKTICLSALIVLLTWNGITGQGIQPISQGLSPLVHNVYNRPSISLNGKWKYLVDRYETSYYSFFRIPYDSLDPKDYGRDPVWLDETPKDKTDRLEYDWDSADELEVPGDWNSQVESLYFYEGSVYYRRKFDDPRENLDNRLLLYFGGANYRTDVYINSKKVGFHTGGFTPFNFEIGDLVKPSGNSLVIRVDNSRDPSGVPMDVTDWWNYGGLTRDVKLLTLPKTFIEDYSIQLNAKTLNHLEGWIQLEGPGSQQKEVYLECEELRIDIRGRTDDKGYFQFREKIPKRKLSLWSPDNPKQYRFKLRTGGDSIHDMIGLRSVSVRGDQVLLNGKPIFLRGICAHEENPVKGGRATGPEDAKLLISWAKELNANFMRLAHYPHNEYMPRLAEEMGILLWEEIPVYWVIDWQNPRTYALAANQLKSMIQRDKNRAAVIIWSLANETPQIPEKVDFLSKLAAEARQLDASRLVSAALFKSKTAAGELTINDPFSSVPDIIAFNEYLGWYEGLPGAIDSVQVMISQDKPVIVSEWGAGALAKFRGDRLTRWTEDYQDYLFEEQLELMDRMPNLVGFTPWILADFRSPRRMHPKYQRGWNRKGVIGQNGERKLAFYRLQAYYQKLKERQE